MDQEIREVLVTLIRGREYIFSMFHRVLGEEPTKVMLEAICSGNSLYVVQIFDSEDSTAAEQLKHILQSCSVDSAHIERMKDEYTRLFIGPNRLIAAPWESVYTTKARALFQASTLEVRNWYRKYHYLPKDYPRVADDHISLMTHFLSMTSKKAVVSLEDGRLKECREILKDQQIFERDHLLNWVSSYADDIQASRTKEFYPQFVNAVADYIKYDNQFIDELLGYI